MQDAHRFHSLTIVDRIIRGRLSQSGPHTDKLPRRIVQARQSVFSWIPGIHVQRLSDDATVLQEHAESLAVEDGKPFRNV